MRRQRPKSDTAPSAFLDMDGPGSTVVRFLAILCAYQLAFTSKRLYADVVLSLTTWWTGGRRWHPNMALAIARCHRLEWLSLRCQGLNAFGTPFTVHWSKVLRHCSRLTHLDLSCCNLGEEAARSLARVFRKLRSLTTVTLDGNKLGDAGVTAIAEALVPCTKLMGLSLRCNLIGDPGVVAVCRLLARVPGLTELDLGRNECGPEGVVAFAAAVQRLPALSSLVLMSCAPATLFRDLRHCPLRSLNLIDVAVGDAGMVALCKELPHFPELATLDVSSTNLNDAGVMTLFAGLSQSHVATLVLTDPILTGLNLGLFAGLGVCPCLTALDLTYSYFGLAGCTSLAIVLHHLPSLSVLDLAHNDIRPAGLVPLAAAFSQCRQLASLNLAGNPLGAEDNEEELPGMPFLCSGRHRSTSLTSLNLRSTNLGDGGVTSFAMALTTWPLLSSLNLADNNLGDEGATVLSHVLPYCPALTELNLTGCRITEPGLASFTRVERTALVVSRGRQVA
jgi:Ran GTPase-activating protein (RanGAP) involved in mRNA processing and transport